MKAIVKDGVILDSSIAWGSEFVSQVVKDFTGLSTSQPVIEPAEVVDLGEGYLLVPYFNTPQPSEDLTVSSVVFDGSSVRQVWSAA